MSYKLHHVINIYPPIQLMIKLTETSLDSYAPDIVKKKHFLGCFAEEFQVNLEVFSSCALK